ncbi:uncharacterized protein MELLADRAFT_67395 [Melampsora larici-populina 98AG31]|uniref:Secreted protein n=1 Tax=Melampsora larici-populina (strain 98AG31 / pathotype 3-4-7) TaxID=747676 RepID=F4S301_MELLP|nr:uncharacterized protein MELLADRAFT_67395 [Melampsora larici-populina 98AG31]EGG00891.1 hypothetical protein MELLADRAFT_67395 [Melampsora larici-populina 98AG31]
MPRLGRLFQMSLLTALLCLPMFNLMSSSTGRGLGISVDDLSLSANFSSVSWFSELEADLTAARKVANEFFKRVTESPVPGDDLSDIFAETPRVHINRNTIQLGGFPDRVAEGEFTGFKGEDYNIKTTKYEPNNFQVTWKHPTGTGSAHLWKKDGYRIFALSIEHSEPSTSGA